MLQNIHTGEKYNNHAVIVFAFQTFCPNLEIVIEWYVGALFLFAISVILELFSLNANLQAKQKEERKMKESSLSKTLHICPLFKDLFWKFLSNYDKAGGNYGSQGSRLTSAY